MTASRGPRRQLKKKPKAIISRAPTVTASATPPPDYRHFWTGLLTAAETVPRNVHEIAGSSGIKHGVIAVGVDEPRKRLLVVSAETDARSAALAQADLQSATPDYRVILARPVVVNFPGMANQASEFLGRTSFGAQDLQAAPTDQQAMQEALQPLLSALTPLIAQWVANAQGVGSIGLRQGLTQAIQQLTSANWLSLEGGVGIELGPLSGLSAIQQDQVLGTCPIPLYAFSGEQMEVIQKGTDRDAVREAFSEHGVLQYFFPAADQVALGLIDRTPLSPAEVGDRLKATPGLGHPYGDAELVSASTQLLDLVDPLRDRKLVVETELHLEITPQGRSLRQEISAKPREALIFKLMNNFKVNIDLKSLFRIGG